MRPVRDTPSKGFFIGLTGSARWYHRKVLVGDLPVGRLSARAFLCLHGWQSGQLPRTVNAVP